MAKRKRLSVPDAGTIALAPAPETKSMFGATARPAPIAEVASDAATSAALQEMSQTLQSARDEGRMVLALPLDQIEAGYLTRDRTRVDDEDMASLIASMRARGQQTPLEVTEIAPGRYGLISGWRRLRALRMLHADTGEDRFAVAKALLRRPDTASEAYVAMVEENEIRADLSYFERAQIVVKSVEQGVFDTQEAALAGLFGAASRARRSKIRSFVTLVAPLGDLLAFPEALSERVGLALARALDEDPGTLKRLSVALEAAEAADPEAERAVLQKVLAARPAPKAPAAPKPAARQVPSRVAIHSELAVVSMSDGRLVLEGRKVNDALRRDLIAWLRAR